jgi:hypothetical protein
VAALVYVDAINNKVGIGDATPATILDVNGTTTTTDLACADCIALTTETSGSYVSAATASQGLTVSAAEGGTVGLQDCAANQILKRNAGDTAWECAADATAAETCSFIMMSNIDPTETSTTFEAMQNSNPGSSVSATETFQVAPVDMDIHTARCWVSAAPGAGKSWTLTLQVNGINDTTIQCIIADAATTGFDIAGTVSVSAGDRLNWEIAPSGTPAAATDIAISVCGNE